MPISTVIWAFLFLGWEKAWQRSEKHGFMDVSGSKVLIVRVGDAVEEKKGDKSIKKETCLKAGLLNRSYLSAERH